jgi:hypothetical protein
MTRLRPANAGERPFSRRAGAFPGGLLDGGHDEFREFRLTSRSSFSHPRR